MANCDPPSSSSVEISTIDAGEGALPTFLTTALIVNGAPAIGDAGACVRLSTMRSGARMLIGIVRLAECGVGLAESVTVKFTEKVPALVGVPETWPAALSVSPGGSADELNAYGAVPPVAVSIAEYDCPNTPSGNEVVVR